MMFPLVLTDDLPEVRTGGRFISRESHATTRRGWLSKKKSQEPRIKNKNQARLLIDEVEREHVSKLVETREAPTWISPSI
jgi:hypothetical protein